MQFLYIADFDITVTGAKPGRETAVAAFEQLLIHLSRWLGGGETQSPSEDELRRAGHLLLPASSAGTTADWTRDASWEVEGAGDVSAIRLEVRQPLGSNAAVFITRVTIAVRGNSTSLRVVMGREVTGGWLSPARVDALHRPGLIYNVVRDETLEVRVLGQRIDGRYENVRDAASTQVLSEAIGQRTRLPIILLHPRSDVGWAVVRRAASGLIGVASVVTLNFAAARTIAELHPALAVPDGGARLVWPDLTASHPRISRIELEERGDEGMRALWMSVLAELSVVARGPDDGWEAARLARFSVAAKAADEALVHARAAGDLRAEIAALSTRLQEAVEEVRFWKEGALQASTEADQLRVKAESLDQAKREGDYWRQEFFRAQGGAAADAPDPWSLVPVLLPSDASAAFEAIETAAEGHLIFTDAASTSWTRSNYPDPEEMTRFLIVLAKAAIDLYANDEAIPRLDEWFKREHGVNVAMSDRKIKDSKALRYFWFDDKKWDQLPHVKVRDGVKPNEVGRIHFALDPEGSRFIVNHVGLKLHSI